MPKSTFNLYVFQVLHFPLPGISPTLLTIGVTQRQWPNMLQKFLFPNLPYTGQKALLILDLFAPHKTQEFKDLLHQNNICLGYIPAGCTGELQPLNVAVNEDLKRMIKSQYADQVQAEVTDFSTICRYIDFVLFNNMSMNGIALKRRSPAPRRC